MPRKESVSREKIFEHAFQLTREEGIFAVTARKLAAKIGCSTQPLFRVYSGMEELWQDLYSEAAVYFEKFCLENRVSESLPFVSLGNVYIRFAAQEGALFRFLFFQEGGNGLKRKSMYSLLNGHQGLVAEEFAKAGGKSREDMEELFTKMWIFVHGAACMTLTGDYDLDAAQTRDLLRRNCRAFMS